jgi:hypothetical protein
MGKIYLYPFASTFVTQERTRMAVKNAQDEMRSKLRLVFIFIHVGLDAGNNEFSR